MFYGVSLAWSQAGLGQGRCRGASVRLTAAKVCTFRCNRVAKWRAPGGVPTFSARCNAFPPLCRPAVQKNSGNYFALKPFCANFAGANVNGRPAPPGLNPNTMTIDKKERMRRAEALFMQGFNCSQAVVAAFADVYGLTEEEALRVSAGLGAGIGRMRLTCGAVCGMAVLAGLECGSTTAGDRQGKSECYKLVQQLAGEFSREHGSITCSELLKLKKGAPLAYEASERTAEYYKTRPCVRQIISAARIYAEQLERIKG